MKNTCINKLIKDVKYTSEIIDENIKTLEIMYKESPVRYKKHIETFILNLKKNLYERKMVITKIDSLEQSEDNFNKILGIIAKLKLLDDKYRMSHKMFKSFMKEWKI
ncbi:MULTISPECIES: hypothetical protein [Clostridium]|uniref:hypothetical protein n=1 Tax=Clostridium TaxID=1485 RepID=UPI0008256F3F|nr:MULTISPECIES: hypothetical protein [Clostridium]PJI06596.1 hypothetical protein CUB90_01380 [Clostridium sp. CT7]